MSPLFVSLVIPTHNRAHLLPRALDSALAQSCDSFQVIVVDDASTDGTVELLEKTQDPRLLQVLRSHPGGAAAARNTGVAHADGDWIAFLDDDDALHPDFLARVAETAATLPPTTGFLWCGTRRFQEASDGSRRLLGEGVWQPRFENRRQAYLAFLRSRRIGTDSGLAVRRSAFDAVGGFDEQLRCAEDTDLLIRLARHYDFAVVPEVLVDIHLHQGPRLTGYGADAAATYELILNKHSAELGTAPATRAALEYKVGWLQYRSGKPRLGRHHLLTALRLRPARVKTWAALLLFEILGRRGAAVHDRLSRLRKRMAD